jgi:polyphosphate kinase
LVGEFLEHSRLFLFGRPGDEDYAVYMGSADMMERNLDRRVEVLVPIENKSLRNEIDDAFTMTFQDDVYTWLLGTDRRWRRRQSVNHFAAQSAFKQLAAIRSRSLTTDR